MKDESSLPMSICPVCQEPLPEGSSVHKACGRKMEKSGRDEKYLEQMRKLILSKPGATSGDWEEYLEDLDIFSREELSERDTFLSIPNKTLKDWLEYKYPHRARYAIEKEVDEEFKDRFSDFEGKRMVMAVLIEIRVLQDEIAKLKKMLEEVTTKK